MPAKEKSAPLAVYRGKQSKRPRLFMRDPQTVAWNGLLTQTVHLSGYRIAGYIQAFAFQAVTD